MNTIRIFVIILLVFALSTTTKAQAPLVINEFMADNDELTNNADEAGQYDDWIELHNGTGVAIDIGGYFLSDRLDNLDKWMVPTGTTINANGYLIFWADDDASQGPLHTNFKLSKSGESFYLTNPSGAIVDSVNYGEQTTSISSARIPNGTGNFVPHAPTFNYNNEATSGTQTPLNDAAFSVFPNPATDFCTLTWAETKEGMSLDFTVLDALGRKIYSDQLTSNGSETKVDITLKQFNSGTYYLHLQTEDYHAVKMLIVE